MIRKRAPEEFINSADKDFVKPTSIPDKKKARGKPYTFYLDHCISEKIDKITLIPRTHRISRSDVIRAGIQLLEKIPQTQLDTLLANTDTK